MAKAKEAKIRNEAGSEVTAPAGLATTRWIECTAHAAMDAAARWGEGAARGFPWLDFAAGWLG